MTRWKLMNEIPLNVWAHGLIVDGDRPSVRTPYVRLANRSTHRPVDQTEEEMSDKWNECMQIKCERFVCSIFKWQRQRQRQPQQPPKTTTTTTMTTPQIATWILHLHFLHLKCHNDIMMTVFGIFHFLLLLFSRWHLSSSPFHFLCKLNSS